MVLGREVKQEGQVQIARFHGLWYWQDSDERAVANIGGGAPNRWGKGDKYHQEARHGTVLILVLETKILNVSLHFVSTRLGKLYIYIDSDPLQVEIHVG